MEITANTLNEAYKKSINLILQHGKLAAPRKKYIYEIEGLHLIITNPKQHFITNKKRKADLRFAIGEFIWYLSESDSLQHIQFYNKNHARYSDDDKTLYGAYGPRIFKEQWCQVVTKLKQDTESRQAVISIFEPRDNGVETKDVPCTVSIQFMVREGKLNMYVNMRSNDFILGFPYDCFSFTLFQKLMAEELGIDVGTYHHYVVSAHIYKEHFELSKEIIESENEFINFTVNVSKLLKSLELEKKLRETQEYIQEEDLMFPYLVNVLNLELADRKNDLIRFNDELSKLPESLKTFISWRN